jgi:hypothetical protein
VRQTPCWLLATALLGTVAPAAAAPARGGPAWCGTRSDDVRDAVWAHREASARRGGRATSLSAGVSRAGQIAVVEDRGDLALVRNMLDLRAVGLRFSPTGDGFSVTRVDTPLVAATGSPLTLGDDDSRRVELPFAFPYFAASHSSVFVNSDGNLTFVEGDSASTARTIGRLVAGPPRMAPLLADLDPSAGGSVTVSSAPDRFSVTWSAVPQWGKSDRNSLQIALTPDGRVEFVYGTELTSGLDEGAVGLGPGREQGGITAVDFSQAAGVVGGGTLAEGFRDSDALDTLGLARRFYSAFPDEFQQLVVYSTRRLTARTTFAYEQTVKNQVSGLGLSRFDSSSDYGSGGRLESFVYMDDLEKHLEPFDTPFLGADSTMSVLAHEVGHRWLANAVFRDGARDSNELLGRDEVHWSFFMDTDGSHLEGNDIEDQGGGRFSTTAASTRFGPLDQYLMGLRPLDEVPAFFFVRDPAGTSGLSNGRDPEAGVSFTGTRRDVTAADLVAAMGPRDPPFGAAPREIRQAFVLVAVGGPPTQAQLDKLERIRAAWPAFYSRSTDGRGTADPRLQ